jgi:hypothetical protein
MWAAGNSPQCSLGQYCNWGAGQPGNPSGSPSFWLHMNGNGMWEAVSSTNDNLWHVCAMREIVVLLQNSPMGKWYYLDRPMTATQTRTDFRILPFAGHLPGPMNFAPVDWINVFIEDEPRPADLLECLRCEEFQARPELHPDVRCLRSVRHAPFGTVLEPWQTARLC